MSKQIKNLKKEIKVKRKFLSEVIESKIREEVSASLLISILDKEPTVDLEFRINLKDYFYNKTEEYKTLSIYESKSKKLEKIANKIKLKDLKDVLVTLDYCDEDEEIIVAVVAKIKSKALKEINR